ncbi:MAG: hypothetical protein IOD12_15920 [Silvanigrellales bacterium]|nr:hypothetical protein [Silvanigrellales bacterium]
MRLCTPPRLLKRVALCMALGGGILSACGDTETKPADVSVLKLKTPLSLSATPFTSTVGLSWFANNSESDFSGYNIYVAEIDPAANPLVKEFELDYSPAKDTYSPITFKDAKGEDAPLVRQKLSKYFNWDANAKVNKPGDGENFAPFVRCNVSKNDAEGPCVSVKTTPAVEGYRANGVVQYVFDDNALSPTKTYAVFVAATRDDGEELASPTSEVIVVGPHVVATPAAAPATFFGNVTNTDTTLIAGLSFAGGTLANASGTFPSSNAFCIPKETTAAAKSVTVFFQLLSGNPYITSANGARISDLGPVIDFEGKVVTSNLLESDQRDEEQVLLPSAEAATPSTTKPAANDMGVPGGYARCGQSRKLFPNHLYAVAFPEGEAWRYAVIESPAKADLEKPEAYRIVIGSRAGQRRL